MQHVSWEHVLPHDIERRSMEIIDQELADRGIVLDPKNTAVIKRAIHTSADFDYAKNLEFSPDAVARGVAALKQGCNIVTDTNMGKSGVSARTIQQLGGTVMCFMADEDVTASAKNASTTRAQASMDKAARLPSAPIVAIGNAPTALRRVAELIDAGVFLPPLVIAVPVGFVNVVAAKEMITQVDVPYIVARGRKGGSNVAAAICNALLYEAVGRTV